MSLSKILNRFLRSTERGDRIRARCSIILVCKNIDDVVFELKFDNGTVICLETSEEDLIVRNWRRKY
jgi:hypothetical protein